MTADYSLETMKATFFRCCKNCQPGIIDPMKLFFRNKKEIKVFSEEGKLKRICHQPTYPKIIIILIIINYYYFNNKILKFLEKKGNDKRKNLGPSVREKNNKE